MDRPTKEQLAEWRREAARWDLRKQVTVGAFAFSSLLAEVDALHHDLAAASLVRSMGEECKQCAMADREREHIMHDAAKAVGGAEHRAETAERERDEARAALVRLRAVAYEVAQSCPSFDEFDDPEERGSSIDAMTALHKALSATPADLADAQRHKWMAATLDEVVALTREQQKEERDDKGWLALDTVACDIEERAANLRGGK